MKRDNFVKYLNYITLIVFIAAICGGLYIIKNGIGLIDGLDFGPGSYFYTDIPDWDKRFFKQEHITFNSDHPIFFAAFFIGWGIASWKLLTLLDAKIK